MVAHFLRAFAVTVLLTGPATAQQDAPSPQMPGAADLAAPADLPTRVIPVPGEEAAVAVSPVLTIDQNRLYLESAWGQRAEAQLEAEGNLIAAENERLTQLLSSEEADLTDRRGDLDPAEFRRLAENFDIRATEVRRERAQAVQTLNGWADADRAAFFRAMLPLMGDMMAERGAVVVLDHRTVLLSLEGIDITEPLIGMVDDRIGDGDGAVPLPDQPTP